MESPTSLPIDTQVSVTTQSASVTAAFTSEVTVISPPSSAAQVSTS